MDEDTIMVEVKHEKEVGAEHYVYLAENPEVEERVLSGFVRAYGYTPPVVYYRLTAKGWRHLYIPVKENND